ncbi:sugar dehydrogenase [Rhodoplanes elegans]|uniref:Sugar dehydrogenase n=1 Tax=Rhodoplanes elegans TaxID=29408 RepID=A0A327K5X6_9BRAD|nr:SDR family oxidoreductase [Rhodoplanes elegans]MBK5961915.1 sugar dehydrogenase [Rhodoplanes elegans]RAI33326.1 sugar dehydrogenase [Rhodoplanes elegans]
MTTSTPAVSPREFDTDLPAYDRMPQLLTGQVALVTGANSGIGQAVAIAMAQAGADVVVNYVAGSADAVVAAIEKTGRRALAVKADVSQEDEVVAMVAQAVKTFGTLDIMVANAGLQRDSALVDMTMAEWNKVIGVNLTGQFLCAREAAKEFLRRGVRREVSVAAGKIVCMSSVHEVIPWAGHVNYASSKGGIQMMMKSLAQELAPHRIRVNAIGPGAIRTPINTSAWNTPEAYAQLMTLVPYRRIGEPQDIANAAVFLASDMADYINGITLFVDGGMTCYPGFATGG